MIKELKPIISLHFIQIRFSLPIFLVFFSLFVALMLLYVMTASGSSFHYSFLAINAYLIFVGLISTRETFPYVIGFSGRRIAYFQATLLFFMTLALFMAILHVLLALIDPLLLQLTGLEASSFSLSSWTHLPEIPLWQIFIYQLLSGFTMLMMTHLLATIRFRFGWAATLLAMPGLLLLYLLIYFLFRQGGMMLAVAYPHYESSYLGPLSLRMLIILSLLSLMQCFWIRKASIHAAEK